MKRVFRQWLAGLLSVVLLFTLLPAAALAEEADGATGPTAVEQVQALIDELPDAEEITADNRADVQAQIDAIDVAMAELTEDEVAALDTTRYDAAAAVLLALDAPSALEQVQALIDALPDAESITADNRADVEAQLTAIDEAKLALEDEEVDALDITRYMAAVEAILALDDMAGADEPRTIASGIPYIDANGGSQTQGSATDITNGTTEWNDGWYVVSGDATISSRITVSGNVNLILEDSHTLTAQQGISVNVGNSLTIYCQSGHTGTLVANNPTTPGDGGGAAIGADRAAGAGSITINEGNITATVTTAGGACIGMGGWDGAAGSVTVNNGHLKLTGNAGGEGPFGAGGTVAINGGIVEYSGSTDGTNSLNHATKQNCIVFSGNSGQVYGNPTITGDVTIPNGKTLTVPGGSTLTVAEGAMLTNKGSIYNIGNIVISGTGKLNNEGTIKNIKDFGKITGEITGTQPETAEGVSYLDWDQNTKSLVETAAPPNELVQVKDSTTTWENNWYVVSGNVTISDRITVKGTVHLILTNGCTLTASKGITVEGNNSLTIYGQSAQGGNLVATGGDDDAGIGGAYAGAGKITINGGNITAQGGLYAAGIGGGFNGEGGKITINGGTVTATGGGSSNYYAAGAGIGGGTASSGGAGTITITGGTVIAKGGSYSNQAGGAGIGDGCGNGSTGTITITGGTITATGGYNAAGIGMSYRAGTNYSSSTFSTGEDGSAVIHASISDTSKQNSWSGVFFEGNSGKVYGNPTPTEGFEVKNNETLTVLDGASLTVAYGVTLTNNGTIYVGSREGMNAALNNEGTIINRKLIDVWGQLTNGEAGIQNQGGRIEYHFKLDVKAPTFENAEYGYTKPEAQKITITNNGEVAATITNVEIIGEDFEHNTGTTGETLTEKQTDDSWTIQPKANLSVGTHTATITVTYSGSGGGTSRTATAEVTFTVVKAETNLTAAPVTYTYGTEGGITLTATVAPAVANGISLISAEQNQVVFSFPKGDKTMTVNDVPAGGGTASVTIPADEVKDYLNPGPNEVTVSYGGSGNLNPKDAVKMTVTVNPKTLTFTFTAKDKTYDGTSTIEGEFNTLTNQLVSSSDNVEVDEYTAVANDENAGTNKAVTVTVSKLKGSEAGYYTPGTATSNAVEIRKAEIDDITAPAANNRTYDGTEKDLVANGSSTQGTIQYALGDETKANGDYSGTIPQEKDAGTYYVWYYIQGDGNHEDSAKDKVAITIGQKMVTLSWEGHTELVYTGTAKDVTATIPDGVIVEGDKENVTVTVTGGNETAANPGSIYTATATLEGSRADNYKLTNNTQTYTISKATATVTVQTVTGTYGEDITITAEVTVPDVDTSLVTDEVTFKAGGTELGKGIKGADNKWTLTLTKVERSLKHRTQRASIQKGIRKKPQILRQKSGKKDQPG